MYNNTTIKNIINVFAGILQILSRNIVISLKEFVNHLLIYHKLLLFIGWCMPHGSVVVLHLDGSLRWYFIVEFTVLDRVQQD